MRIVEATQQKKTLIARPRAMPFLGKRDYARAILGELRVVEVERIESALGIDIVYMVCVFVGNI